MQTPTSTATAIALPPKLTPRALFPPFLQDVWNMKWSDDDPDLFAAMEKNKMVVLRGLDAEEPVTTSAFLCSFHDLEIRGVHLDDIMQLPEEPEPRVLATFETRSLRCAQRRPGGPPLRPAHRLA